MSNGPPSGAFQGGGGRGLPYRDQDLVKWQFWPKAVAMGSLIGRQFIQMLAAAVEFGPDHTGLMPGMGLSYLAFNFRNESIAIRSRMLVRSLDALPPALRLIDAQFAFDDIASGGIIIEERFLREERDPCTGHLERWHNVTVTICTRRPPKFFIPFTEGRDSINTNVGRPNIRTYRRRATAMDFAISGISERDAGPIPAIPEGPCAYPTFWDTWRFSFQLNDVFAAKLRACTRMFDALAEQEPEMSLVGHRRLLVQSLDRAAYAKLYSVPDMEGIRFSTRTLIEGLVAHGIIKPGDTRGLVEALRENAVVPAFQDRILESLYSEERVRDVKRLIRGRAGFLRHIPAPNLAHLVMVRTVLVTPTRLVISPPQREPSNSVTRRYADRIDAVIRVQFADEEDKLFVLDGTREADKLRSDIGIMARVRRALKNGIVLGGRRFMPVASSASQQKDHAIWFIDTTVIDGLELRRWMGNVDETVVAKHAARMGLPFSTSRIVDLRVNIGPNLPDVERNGYCFTDGVGVAGTKVMREAARALGSTKGLDAQPSAIQFRLGGAKGVLAWWPHLASEHEVRLRKSMIKFKSELVDLNVVRLARYQMAFLNRQFIMIMCANGVPEQLIVDLFADAVKNTRGLRNRVKEGILSREDFRLVSTCSEFPMKSLIKAGFHADPLVLDIADLIECRTLQDLKWRARIKINDGVFLIGIADELGVLGPDEVFCQYQENEDSRPVVVESECLICRAPALHPGDVRRATAVNHPGLRHLKNVIVFGTTGDRDLPNKLGGGDLDGDDYTLIWDQRFVRLAKQYPAMDYTAPAPIRVSKVTQEHLNENFVNYILNDVLGQVDFWHMAWSDRYTPFHNDCLHLAEIHSSDSVDFAKTGIPADLAPRLRPREWPDFMDRDNNKRTYQSQKILGRIFRLASFITAHLRRPRRADHQVQPDPHFRPSDLRAMGYPVDKRLSQYPIYDSLIRRLEPIKARYEADMQYDMRRYRVFEPEIPSGIAIKNKRRKRARDQNLNEPLREAYETRKLAVRQAAAEAIEPITFTSALSPMQIVGRHAYAMTFEKEHVERWEQQLREGSWGGRWAEEDSEMQELRRRPMMSFAWVFAKELVEIVSGQS